MADTHQPPLPLAVTRPDEIGDLIGGFNRVLADLGQREALLKQILDTSSVAIFLVDQKGRITQANQRMAEMFGCSLDALEGSEYLALIHPSEREIARQNMLALQANIIPSADVDQLFWRADRSEFWGRLTAKRFIDASGAPRGLLAVIADITARKAQQTQLMLAAQVFAQSREGIVVTDAQGNIVMVNAAFTTISGYAETEVLGKNPRLMSSGRQGPEFYRAMWDAINAWGHWAGEIWNRRKDGTSYPGWLAISAMRDAQGQITHYLGNFSDLSDAKAAENRIQLLSHFDALTGLPNRALLEDRTMHSISMAQRASEPLTMMLVGIDHFARINDALGHPLSDALLVEMAKRLGNSVREQDTVARLGTNEFVLVLPGTPASGAAHLASKLLWKLAEPYDLGNQETTLTASIGIANYPDNGSDFDALLKSVEIALHRAQTSGRDSFQFYSDDMYQQVLKHDSLTKALRHAAALEQFQLVYQPLVDLQTGQISGLEALLRWQHPELGAVSPTQFIPAAEEAGLIKGIGEWVLRRACRDIRIWLDKGIKVPHVAVNVSPVQFHDNDLIAQVKSALAAAQVDPALIYLEVTEGALMNDVPRSEAMLKELKTLGVKLSLDDFGTGYSSLSYLKRFPFDKVKIDQSFVRDITTNPSDKVIAQVIVSMAHGLGLKVIAEGVETEAQCEIMRTSVCDEIQGYFFSRPVSAQAIEELFAEGRQLPPHLLRLQKPQRTLLLVDDEPNIVAALKRLFRRDGHVILTANSGAEGLDVLAKHKVDVIISDQRMPGMTGVEFLRAAKVNHPDTIRIVLSGFTELKSVTDAINEGAVYRFLTKPWEDEQLREHVIKAFEYKELQDENRQLDMKIRTSNQELVAANRQLGEVLQGTHDQIERDQTSLAIMREALQLIPLPVIGVDDDGLIAFVNAAAEQLFSLPGPLLGVALAHALPTLDAAVAAAPAGEPTELRLGNCSYQVSWHRMGANSRSQGKTVTLTLTMTGASA
jgi:diguanylate cyclase (GGDEF)-like protein/PAS domain S-box-containing protein